MESQSGAHPEVSVKDSYSKVLTEGLRIWRGSVQALDEPLTDCAGFQPTGSSCPTDDAAQLQYNICMGTEQ